MWTVTMESKWYYCVWGLQYSGKFMNTSQSYALSNYYYKISHQTCGLGLSYYYNITTNFSDPFIAYCFSCLRFASGTCSCAPVMFIFPLLPKRRQICDSCHFPEGSASNLPRACRRDISSTLSFDWVFFTALPFREATSTSTSCQALLLNHVISQKHRKNSHVTRQRTSPWMGETNSKQ